MSNARTQYLNYLNEYWKSGDMSNIDSALIYNAHLVESDSVGIIDYLYRIQMLDLCGRYDSILSFVDRIPPNMLSWPPEYKSYLRFKCKAIMANDADDSLHYRDCLDSIMMIWRPLMSDSIAKTDSLFSTPIDNILDRYGYLLDSYIRYYEILSLLHGEDSVEQILATKKELYNWNDETYSMIIECINGDAVLSLP
ncbi:MAG: hypothetical protein AUK63_2401 [bacterium P3]|nr:MAG: hypothetical protein AUK63_2401 [bacterium P3]